MESKHQGENAEHMLAAIAAALAAHQSPRTLQRQAVQHFAALNEWQIDKYDFSLKKLGQRQPPTARALLYPPDLIHLSTAWSVNLYGVLLGLSDQRARDR
jgi:hypothetical protein